jgi:hypothetical protein
MSVTHPDTNFVVRHGQFPASSFAARHDQLMPFLTAMLIMAVITAITLACTGLPQ